VLRKLASHQEEGPDRPIHTARPRLSHRCGRLRVRRSGDRHAHAGPTDSPRRVDPRRPDPDHHDRHGELDRGSRDGDNG